MQHDAGALGVDRIDSFTSRETTAKLDHALSEAYLPKTLVALFVGEDISWAAVLGCAVAAPFCARLSTSRGIVDYLVLDGFVGRAETGVVDGQEAELGGNDASC